MKRKSDDGQDGIEAKGGRASGERQKENGQDMTTDRPGLRRKEEEQPGRSRERRSGGAFCFDRENVRRIPARKACCGEKRAKEIKSGEKMADRFAAGRKDSGRKE